MQQLIFVFHTHSHGHTEWLLTPLSVSVTEKTQGFLSHPTETQNRAHRGSEAGAKSLLLLTWKLVFAERDNYENKTSSSSWIGYRSQKLTMCKYSHHMKLRKQPRMKGFLKCSKIMPKKMWWLSYKIHSSNFSNPRFLLDTRDSRHTFNEH